MRRLASLVLLGATLSGCGLGKRLGLGDEVPGHKEPKSTSIYGDWVLATPADSTAFAGATQVELKLERSRFTVKATYPGQSSPTVVSGIAARGESGLITLTPNSGAQRLGRQGAFVLTDGTPIVLVASAAGNTLLFSPPKDDPNPSPSSIWYKRGAAVDAGRVSKTTAKP